MNVCWWDCSCSEDNDTWYQVHCSQRAVIVVVMLSSRLTASSLTAGAYNCSAPFLALPQNFPRIPSFACCWVWKPLRMVSAYLLNQFVVTSMNAWAVWWAREGKSRKLHAFSSVSTWRHLSLFHSLSLRSVTHTPLCLSPLSVSFLSLLSVSPLYLPLSSVSVTLSILCFFHLCLSVCLSPPISLSPLPLSSPSPLPLWVSPAPCLCLHLFQPTLPDAAKEVETSLSQLTIARYWTASASGSSIACRDT